jgi:hypothetical protein
MTEIFLNTRDSQLAELWGAVGISIPGISKEFL